MRRMLARVHALLGVVPLGLFLVYHLKRLWPVVGSRDAWLDGAGTHPSGRVLVALVLTSLAAHAVLGGIRSWRARSRGPALPQSAHRLRILQAVTGALVLCFLGYHLRQVWNPGPAPERGALAVYGVLWRELGRPFDVGIYVVGISAVAFHFGHGLSRVPDTLGLTRSVRAVFWSRLMAGALAFALWAALLQVLARFALGEPVLP